MLNLQNSKSLKIPYGVKKIRFYAFSENSLEYVYISNSVEEIHDGVFYNNKLTSVYIPDSVKIIAADAFQGNPLTTVSIKEGTEYEVFSFPETTKIIIRL